MGIYKPSADVLLAAINSQNSLAIKATDFTYSVPKDIRGTDQAALVPGNTSIKITATDAGTWSGKRTLDYTRYSLPDLKILIGDTLSINAVDNVAQLIPVMNNRYGTVFDAGDLDTSIPVTWNMDGQTGTVRLKALATSLGWVDEVMFNVEKGDASLATQLTVTQMQGLKYPNDQLGSIAQSGIFGEMYSYPYDFTLRQADMLTLTAGVLAAGDKLTLLTAIMVAITGGSWEANGTSTWGLLGAEIVSNGLNSSAYPTNQKYKYVLVLKMAPSMAQFKGTMYLQYNDPEDPNEV